MADVNLVSIGDDIKLWDSNYMLYKQTNPHGPSTWISSIAWNPERSFLASSSISSDKIALLCVKSPSLCVPPIPIENKAGGMCVSFNSNSRYLLIGRSDNAISIYDCKRKIYQKTYKHPKGSVTTAQFNWNDTYIASGSESGEIILHSVVTGQSCSPLVADGVQAIRQVQYSYYDKSLLASASDDGAINLWNASSRRLVHSYSQGHRAPASGVAFSPLSALLLCSAGLDKRILLCDTRGKSVMNTIVTESPLTSIDMKSDGSTVAVGSTRGKIYVYDIRQGKSPIKLLSAHRSSVQMVKFKNPPDDHSLSHSKTSAVKESVKSPPQQRQLPPAPVPVPTIVSPEKQPNDSYQDSSESRHQDHMAGMTVDGFFSPLREGLGDSMTASLHISRSNDSTNLEMEGLNIFSPLAENKGVLKSGRRVTGVTGVTGVEASYVISPLAGHVPTSLSTSKGGSFTLPDHQITFRDSSERGQSSAVLEASPLISHPLPTSSHRSAVSNTSTDSRANLLNSRDNPASPSLPITERMEVDKEEKTHKLEDASLLPRNIDFEDKLHVPPAISVTDTAKSSGVTSNGSSYQQNGGRSYTSSDRLLGRGDHSVDLPEELPSPREAQAFQEKLLRNLVKEAVEEVRDQLHGDLLSLHMEMIRQFQIQLGEVNAMLSQYTGNTELLAEVKRLREENTRLKRTF